MVQVYNRLGKDSTWGKKRSLCRPLKMKGGAAHYDKKETGMCILRKPCRTIKLVQTVTQTGLRSVPKKLFVRIKLSHFVFEERASDSLWDPFERTSKMEQKVFHIAF